MAADGKLNLALIGAGGFGVFCMETYSRMDALRPTAVADMHEPAAKAAGERFGIPHFSDAAEMIARPDVDIVHISTPPSSHHALAMQALDAGKHVLCEKPLALTPKQGEQILAAAGKAGRICPVNFVLRYNQVSDAVKRVIDSGVLGKPLGATLTNCAGDSVLGPDHWFWDKSLSGGIFVEHGVHFFDLYSYWLGGRAEVLFAHAETREGTTQEDRVMCTFRHGPTVARHYHGFDQVRAMDRTDHRIVCELGDICVDGWIPLTLNVDAVVDRAGEKALAACCPGAELRTVADFGDREKGTPGRGVPRDITRRVTLTWTPEPDKGAVYRDSVRALMADQVAFIRDASHRRRVTEDNGLAALRTACEAAQAARQ